MGLSPEEFASTFLPREMAIFLNNLAPGNGNRGISMTSVVLVDRVVSSAVKVVNCQPHFLLRIEDNKIGIAAYRNCTFLGPQSK
jgi:hypothetical protein